MNKASLNLLPHRGNEIAHSTAAVISKQVITLSLKAFRFSSLSPPTLKKLNPAGTWTPIPGPQPYLVYATRELSKLRRQWPVRQGMG